VQYQVRVGVTTLLIEQLRDSAPPQKEVTLSFSAEDSLLFAE